MARYGGRKQKYDIRDVHEVAVLYNRIWRDYARFPTTGRIPAGLPRPSREDLWRVGKPYIESTGTVGEGVARLQFIFQDFTKEDAEQWARNFIRENKAPYTDIETKTRRDLRGNAVQPPGAELPTVIVNVEFRMHPDFR
jgi:hypothetical protein